MYLISLLGDNAADNWKNLVESSSNFVVSMGVGLFFTVAMILIGFIWCCARSCCCSRKRSSPGDGCSLAIGIISTNTIKNTIITAASIKNLIIITATTLSF